MIDTEVNFGGAVASCRQMNGTIAAHGTLTLIYLTLPCSFPSHFRMSFRIRRVILP